MLLLVCVEPHLVVLPFFESSFFRNVRQQERSRCLNAKFKVHKCG